MSFTRTTTVVVAAILLLAGREQVAACDPCAGGKCTEDSCCTESNCEYCELATGDCVSRCDATKCEECQCVDQCVDYEDPDCDVSGCRPGYKCIVGVCWCIELCFSYSCQSSCPSGWCCQAGGCVDSCDPACYEADCDDGQCVPLCNPDDCLECNGSGCDDNCPAGDCLECDGAGGCNPKECPVEGQVCISGECVCDSSRCWDDDSSGGCTYRCTDDDPCAVWDCPGDGGPCFSTPVCSSSACCPSSDPCTAGTCVSNACQYGPKCPPGECCDGGTCKPKCGDDCCTADQCCVDSQCVAKCNGQCCQDGQCCRDGQCVSKCGTSCCPSGQCCADSQCVTVTLTRSRARVSRDTPAPQVTALEKQSVITVATDPPDYENYVTLALSSLDLPPGQQDMGSLTQISSTQWVYTSWAEPFSDIHPTPSASIDITPMLGASPCGPSVSVSVRSAYGYLTGPDVITLAPGQPGAGAQYSRAKDFVEAKYAGCLNMVRLVGGNFSSEAISDDVSVCCPFWPFNCGVSACTREWDSVTFGIGPFYGGENIAAATILHELAHTVEDIEYQNQTDCYAYTWEVGTAWCTGLQGGDLAAAQQLQQQACGNNP